MKVNFLYRNMFSSNLNGSIREILVSILKDVYHINNHSPLTFHFYAIMNSHSILTKTKSQFILTAHISSYNSDKWWKYTREIIVLLKP